MAAIPFRGFPANGRSRFLPPAPMGTDESVNYSGSSRSEKGASNFLSANLERQLHFQLRTLAPIVPNQESRSKGSFKSSWFWGRQCPFMAESVSSADYRIAVIRQSCTDHSELWLWPIAAVSPAPTFGIGQTPVAGDECLSTGPATPSRKNSVIPHAPASPCCVGSDCEIGLMPD
jgi:hypothetical protein